MGIFGSGKLGANKKGKIDVFVNDQTNPYFQYFLINELKNDITLTSDITKDDEKANVSSGHGFVGGGLNSGEMFTIFENNRSAQVRVKSVLNDEVTLEIPFANDFTAAGSIIYRGDYYLNRNGSTPINYQMNIKDFTIPIDISKIVLTMTHVDEGNDGLFGGIAALSNGIWFRKENGTDFNLGNYINNQDFKDKGADVTYLPKGPGASESTTVIFDLIEIFGSVTRMDARNADNFKGQIRDDLTGLSGFRISLVGSYTDEN